MMDGVHVIFILIVCHLSFFLYCFILEELCLMPIAPKAPTVAYSKPQGLADRSHSPRTGTGSGDDVSSHLSTAGRPGYLP